LSGKLLLRESPFHIVNCLKLFNFTLFFVYTSGSQTFSSRYPHQGSDYILLPSIFWVVKRKQIVIIQISTAVFVPRYPPKYRILPPGGNLPPVWEPLVYTLKLLKGRLWHIFLLYFEKHMTFSRNCGSRVVHQLLNKTMKKL